MRYQVGYGRIFVNNLRVLTKGYSPKLRRNWNAIRITRKYYFLLTMDGVGCYGPTHGECTWNHSIKHIFFYIN